MTDIQVYNPEQANQYRFNPAEHLMQIKSSKGASEYLEVKFRLVWFRSLCPQGTIRTEVVHLDMDRETEEETYAWNNETRRSEKIIKRAPGIAIFRAIIDDGKGGHAEATKCEKAASFGDYLEKAETGAIGRALAMLGYGTQFVGEEFDEGHRIVDAPVAEGRAQAKQPTEAEQDAYKKRRTVVESKPVQPTKPQVAAPAVPPIEQIRELANKVYTSDGGYADFKSLFVGKYELGDIPDSEIPERIRAEMAELIRTDVADRRKAKQPVGA